MRNLSVLLVKGIVLIQLSHEVLSVTEMIGGPKVSSAPQARTAQRPDIEVVQSLSPGERRKGERSKFK